MTAHRPDPAACRHRDAVVAAFLDGAAVDVPAEHLAACAACREYLAQCRRLDALLAATGSVDVDETVAARMLAVAVRARRVPTTQRRAGKRAAALAVAAATAAAVAFTWWSVSAPTFRTVGESTSEDVAAAPPTDAVQRSSAPGVLALDRPDGVAVAALTGAPRTSAGRTNATPAPPAPGVPRLTELLFHGAAALRQQPAAWWTACSCVAVTGALPEPERVDGAVRTAATRALLARDTAFAHEAVMRYLATGDCSTPAWRDAAAAAGGSAPFARVLQRACRRQQPGPHALLAAARLGVVDDVLLERAARQRNAGAADGARTIARVVAEPPARPGAVPFLLDLWEVLAARGDAAAEEVQRAPSWFVPLPREATAALLHEARTTRHAVRRHRCLLALGARRDPTAAPTLLAFLDAASWQEAVTAGWALSRLPVEATATLLQRTLDATRRPELLLAALQANGALPLGAAVAQRCGTRPFDLPSYQAAALALRGCRPRD